MTYKVRYLLLRMQMKWHYYVTQDMNKWEELWKKKNRMKKLMASNGQEVYAVVKKGFKVRAVCNNPFPQPEFEPFGDMVDIYSIMASKEDAVRTAEQLTEQNSIYQYEVREYELG
ncbi:hypothetical protein [Enterococcus sp. DIV1096b]|uniref:hypothetical protein n=1 Tax=Enterococcus sp. DIV1096b TaxID=2774709 RepID=UPI003D2ADCC2